MGKSTILTAADNKFIKNGEQGAIVNNNNQKSTILSAEDNQYVKKKADGEPLDNGSTAPSQSQSSLTSANTASSLPADYGQMISNTQGQPLSTNQLSGLSEEYQKGSNKRLYDELSKSKSPADVSNDVLNIVNTYYDAVNPVDVKKAVGFGFNATPYNGNDNTRAVIPLSPNAATQYNNSISKAPLVGDAIEANRRAKRDLITGVQKGEPDKIRQFKDLSIQSLQDKIDAINKNPQGNIDFQNSGAVSFGSNIPKRKLSDAQQAEKKMLQGQIDHITNTFNDYTQIALVDKASKNPGGLYATDNVISLGNQLRAYKGVDVSQETNITDKTSKTEVNYLNEQAGLNAIRDVKAKQYAYYMKYFMATNNPQSKEAAANVYEQLSNINNSIQTLPDKYAPVRVSYVARLMGEYISNLHPVMNVFITDEDRRKAVENIEKDYPGFSAKYSKEINFINSNGGIETNIPHQGFVGAFNRGGVAGTNEILNFGKDLFGVRNAGDRAADEINSEFDAYMRGTAQGGGGKVVLNKDGLTFEQRDDENYNPTNFNSAMSKIGNFIGGVVPFVASTELGGEGVAALVGRVGKIADAINGTAKARRLANLADFGETDVLGLEAAMSPKLPALSAAQKQLAGNLVGNYVMNFDNNLNTAERLIKDQSGAGDAKKALVANLLTWGQTAAFSALPLSTAAKKLVTEGLERDAGKLIADLGEENILNAANQKGFKQWASNYVVPRILSTVNTLKNSGATIGKGLSEMVLMNHLNAGISNMFDETGATKNHNVWDEDLQTIKDMGLGMIGLAGIGMLSRGAVNGLHGYFTGEGGVPNVLRQMFPMTTRDALYEAAGNVDENVSRLRDNIEKGLIDKDRGNQAISIIRTAGQMYPLVVTAENDGLPKTTKQKAQMLAEMVRGRLLEQADKKQGIPELMQGVNDNLDAIQADNRYNQVQPLHNFEGDIIGHEPITDIHKDVIVTNADFKGLADKEGFTDLKEVTPTLMKDFKDGDRVEFNIEGKREGTWNAERGLIVDDEGKPWGLTAILNDKEGYVKKINAPVKTEVQVGNEVQWVRNGVEQFEEPVKVTKISTDGTHVQVENSTKWLPIHEIENLSSPKTNENESNDSGIKKSGNEEALSQSITKTSGENSGKEEGNVSQQNTTGSGLQQVGNGEGVPNNESAPSITESKRTGEETTKNGITIIEPTVRPSELINVQMPSQVTKPKIITNEKEINNNEGSHEKMGGEQGRRKNGQENGVQGGVEERQSGRPEGSEKNNEQEKITQNESEGNSSVNAANEEKLGEQPKSENNRQEPNVSSENGVRLEHGDSRQKESKNEPRKLLEPSPERRKKLANDLSVLLGKNGINFESKGDFNKPISGKLGNERIIKNEGNVFHTLRRVKEKYPEYSSLIDDLLSNADRKSLSVATTLLNGDKEAQRAFYNSNTDKIYFDGNFEDMPRYVVHETIHAMTALKIPEFFGDNYGETYLKQLDKYAKENPKSVSTELINVYKDAINSAGIKDVLFSKNGFANNSKELSRLNGGSDFIYDNYGFYNIHEFLAESFTNPDFQKKLQTLQSGNKTVWDRFVDFVKKALGIKSTTALDNVINIGKKIISSERPKENENYGKHFLNIPERDKTIQNFIDNALKEGNSIEDIKGALEDNKIPDIDRFSYELTNKTNTDATKESNQQQQEGNQQSSEQQHQGAGTQRNEAAQPPTDNSNRRNSSKEPEERKVGVSHESLSNLAKKLGLPEPERGKRLTPEEYAYRGRQLLNAGADVEKLEKDFKAGKQPTADDISVARAHLEDLNLIADAMKDKFGLDSPQYDNALKEIERFTKEVVKPMGTEASVPFTALQGQRDLDTNSFTAVKTQVQDLTGKKTTKEQNEKIEKLTSKNDELQKEVDRLQKELVTATEKTIGEEEEQQKKSPKQIKENAKKVADAIRKGKLSRPDTFSSASPASLVWDGALETAAKLIEAGGTLAQAISDGIEHIKQSEWYKNLSKDKQKEAEDVFTNHMKSSMLTPENRKDVKNIAAYFANKTDNKFTPDEAKAIWDYAKNEYLEKGVEYRDMIKAVANDLGLSWKQVSDAITSPKVKRISDEMWKKQHQLRRNQLATKIWIDEQAASPFVKAFKKVSGAFRSLAVFGHGGIFVGTHAGMTLFQPSTWKHTIPAFFRGWKYAYGNIAAYEREMEDLKNNPNYTIAQRAGLKNNPDLINAEEYQKSQKYLGNVFGKIGEKLGGAGERGFNAIKVLRQNLFDTYYNQLSAADKQDPNVVKSIAGLINNATGATNLNLPNWVNEATFAGGMEASRWGKLTRNPARATATALKAIAAPSKVSAEDRVFAKIWARRVGEQLATYGSLLAANAAIQAIVNPNNPTNLTNPSQPGWLKFKFGDTQIDPSSGMLGVANFIGGLGKIATESQKELHGKTRLQALGELGAGYGRGKLAPFYSTLVDLATQSDFYGNPLPWSSDKPRTGKHTLGYLEYLGQKLPLPVAEALNVTFKSAEENGMGKTQFKDIITGILSGAISGSTGFRVSESKEKNEPFSKEDEKAPEFKYFLDKGLELPNTSPKSEVITDNEAGTKMKLSEYPKEVQEQYATTHKQILQQELSNIIANGNVYVKSYSDGNGNITNEVSLNPPTEGTYKTVGLNDLDDSELEQVLHLAQSNATKATKKQMFKKGAEKESIF